MHTSSVDPVEQVRAVGARFSGNMLYVVLSDGREVGLPVDRIDWLNWLARATPEQRERWSLEPDGYAVYWEELDDGIEVQHILEAQPIA
jgi:hypothetical protein